MENRAAPAVTGAEQVEPRRGRIAAWARLLRVPNLFSVPGDPLAGAALASLGVHDVNWSAAAVAAVSSLLLYCGGLIDNDVVDVREDSREERQRPLCKGLISCRAASTARALLLASGVLLSASLFRTVGYGPLLVSLLIVAAIVSYNRLKTRYAVIGWILMGICRGLSLLLGASTAELQPNSYVTVAALGWTLYVASVTAFAHTETRRGLGALRRFAPAASAYTLAAVSLVLHDFNPLDLLVIAGAITGSYALLLALSLGSEAEPRRIQAGVGALICALIWMQAVACLSANNGWSFAGGLVVAHILARQTGRRFYAS